MTIKDIAAQENITVSFLADDRPVERVFCCDLLSVAMARAPENSAWVTVMTNANVVAVASLADVSCVILAEGYDFDPAAVEAAKKGRITLLRSRLPVYETAAGVGAGV